MFAVFTIAGNDKSSGDYGNPKVARHLCREMNDKAGKKRYKVRQMVREDGQKRAKWRDL